MRKITRIYKTMLIVAMAFTLPIVNSASAQVLSDETPANWKFDEMEKGNAKNLFVVEGAEIGANLKYPFRLADTRNGAFVMNQWQAGVKVTFADMSDEQKAAFNSFYDACQIIDGGSMGKIFCYQGKNSTVAEPRATKNQSAFGGASINILTGSEHPYGDYRITLTLRVVVNEGAASGNMRVYVGTSHWDGIDANGGTGTGYRSFNIPYAPAYNKYWVSYAYDFRVKENKDASYKVLPVVTKISLGPIGNNGLLLIDDIKLEKIQNVDNNYIPMKQQATTLNDEVTSVATLEADNLIVFAKDGMINVLDAQSPIEIYTVSGKLVAQKQPSASTLTTFNLTEKGIYIVKTAEQVRKVVL